MLCGPVSHTQRCRPELGGARGLLRLVTSGCVELMDWIDMASSLDGGVGGRTCGRRDSGFGVGTMRSMSVTTERQGVTVWCALQCRCHCWVESHGAVELVRRYRLAQCYPGSSDAGTRGLARWWRQTRDSSEILAVKLTRSSC